MSGSPFEQIRGLVAATFTPMNPDGSVNLEPIPEYVDHLISDGLAGLYINGSTGEGPSLTIEERRRVAEAFVRAADGRIPTVIQVGHDSLGEAAGLSAHAASIGAWGISALPPTYFRPPDVDTLIECVEKVTEQAPDLPFYPYHIPRLSGVDLDMAEFLDRAVDRIPTVAGIKFSDFQTDRCRACVTLRDGRFNVLFGSDEMLLAGLTSGAHGAVGSTYNFLGPLFNRVIAAYRAGEVKNAERLQGDAIQMIHTIVRFPAGPALKASMRLVGFDFGPSRLPLKTLSPEQFGALELALKADGFDQTR